jgi:hypothetical protein
MTHRAFLKPQSGLRKRTFNIGGFLQIEPETNTAMLRMDEAVMAERLMPQAQPSVREP